MSTDLPSTPDTAAAGPERRSDIADTIISTIAHRFPHWDIVPDLDFEERTAAYRRDAVNARSRRAFALVTMAYLARFRNGHTLFRDPYLDRNSGGPLPFSLRHVVDGWVVYASHDSRLPDGSALRMINGLSTEAFFRRRRTYLSASTDRAARHLLFARGGMETTYLIPRRLKLTLGDGAQLVIERPGESTGAGIAGRDQYRVTDRSFDSGAIGYIKIPGFSPYEHRRRAEELVRTTFRDAPALIIDVRGAWGGATPSDLIQALMDRPWQWWTGETHQPPRSEPAYRGELIILIDGGCVSACEDFVMPFSLNHRATIVGEATAGSSGQPAVLSLAEGAEAWVASRSMTFPNGGRFESVGITPDVDVRPTVADFRASPDPELDAALEIARLAIRDRR